MLYFTPISGTIMENAWKWVQKTKQNHAYVWPSGSWYSLWYFHKLDSFLPLRHVVIAWQILSSIVVGDIQGYCQTVELTQVWTFLHICSYNPTEKSDAGIYLLFIFTSYFIWEFIKKSVVVIKQKTGVGKTQEWKLKSNCFVVIGKIGILFLYQGVRLKKWTCLKAAESRICLT